MGMKSNNFLKKNLILKNKCFYRENISKKHRVRVATSDGLEQLIILGNGAYRVSANEFKKEVDMVEKAIREFLKK